jgi:hypothetical protein
MQCARCAGMRVPEMISEGGMRVMALRCILCGDIVDQVIARNRERRRHSYPRRPRTPTYGSNRSKQNRLVWI